MTVAEMGVNGDTVETMRHMFFFYDLGRIAQSNASVRQPEYITVAETGVDGDTAQLRQHF